MHDDELGVVRSRELIELVLRHYPQAWYSAGPFDEWPVVAAGLIRRATQCLGAVISLQRGCFYSDAAVLTRAIFEHVTAFAWIAVSPDKRIGPWLKHDLKTRLAAHKALVEIGETGLLEDHVVAQFETYIANVKDNLPKPAEQAKVADEHWSAILDRQPTWKDKGGFSGMYRITYRYTSKFAHPTIIGFQPHIVEFGAGVVVVGDEVAETDASAFVLAPGVLGMGLRVASIALGWPTIEQIDEVFRK